MRDEDPAKNASEAGPTRTTSSPTSEAAPPLSTMNNSPSRFSDDQLQRAIDDLAERLNSKPAKIEVEVDELVTWSDGSIGCPRPGMSYTQALVPGRRIVLSHEGAPFVYHATNSGAPFLCPIGRAIPPAPGGDI